MILKSAGINLSEGLTDGTFTPAKKGAPVSVKLSAERVQRFWASATKMVLLPPSGQKTLRPYAATFLEEPLDSRFYQESADYGGK